MNVPQIDIALPHRHGPYQPGERLVGTYDIRTEPPDEIRAIEVSVLWHTLGKGEEDLGVHYFKREAFGEHDDVSAPRSFETTLPNSPLSYDGAIVKICWCVRVRLFLRGGREVMVDEPFDLGDIPPPETTR